MVLYLQTITMSGTTAEISPVAVIDKFESLIWVRRYDTPGDFELYMPADKDIFALIKANLGYLILTREDSRDVMYVEYVKLTENEESGDYILLKGRSIDCVMERRVIGYPTKILSMPTTGVITKLINENMISPVSHEGYGLDALHRTLAPFEIVTQVYDVEMIAAQYNGENLLSAVGELLKSKTYGLTTFLYDGTILLRIYSGQERPNVRFSPNNENLISSEYECDIRGQCNSVFVYAEGDEEHTQADGSNAYTVTRQYPISSTAQKYNYRRYEGYTVGSAATMSDQSAAFTRWLSGKLVDGEPVASTYAVYCPSYINIGVKLSVTWVLTSDTANSWGYASFYNARSEFIGTKYIANGDTITPLSGATKFRVTLYKSMETTLVPADVSSASYTALRDRPLYEYQNAVAEQGAALINTVTDSIKGETIETGLYTIGTDYDLGDTVHVENSYGISGTARVSETTERFDAEGYHIYPTFTDWTVTT